MKGIDLKALDAKALGEKAILLKTVQVEIQIDPRIFPRSVLERVVMAMSNQIQEIDLVEQSPTKWCIYLKMLSEKTPEEIEELFYAKLICARVIATSFEKSKDVQRLFLHSASTVLTKTQTEIQQKAAQIKSENKQILTDGRQLLPGLEGFIESIGKIGVITVSTNYYSLPQVLAAANTLKSESKCHCRINARNSQIIVVEIEPKEGVITKDNPNRAENVEQDSCKEALWELQKLFSIRLLAQKRKEYQSFEERFNNFLQEREEKYPLTVNYLRSYYLQTLAPGFSSLENQISPEEAFWQNFETVLSDILGAAQITLEELLNVKNPILSSGTNDFETIKDELYETPVYPIMEHLYYTNFEPALARVRFISKKLGEFQSLPLRFCDLGFGPGVLFSHILQMKSSWYGYGVDISRECTAYAQRMVELKNLAQRSVLSIADVRRLPYLDDTFDLVIGMEVFEHIPDPKEGLVEAVRVLKAGGHAIISLPVQLPLTMHLYNFKTPEEVLECYHQVGLHVLDFEALKFTGRTHSFIDTFALCIKE